MDPIMGHTIGIDREGRKIGTDQPHIETEGEGIVRMENAIIWTKRCNSSTIKVYPLDGERGLLRMQKLRREFDF